MSLGFGLGEIGSGIFDDTWKASGTKANDDAVSAQRKALQEAWNENYKAFIENRKQWLANLKMLFDTDSAGAQNLTATTKAIAMIGVDGKVL